MKSKKIIAIILTVFLTFIVCSAIGFLFYGMKVFNPESSTFGLISYGAVGALAFSALYLTNLRIALITIILLFISVIFLNYDSFAKTPLTASLYFISAAVSAYIHSEYIFKRMTIDKFIRPLLLSGLFTITFGISAIITILASAVPGKMLLFIPVAGLGTVIGLCIGMSIEFAETLTERIASK